MQVLNCLIVEDESLAARVIADYVAQMPELKLVAICEDVPTAKSKLETENIDLIFLDINLPKINGIEFIRMLDKKCRIILITAYHQYAVEGFELDVVDYLLKPVSFERFTKAVNKVLEQQKLQELNKGATVANHMFVKAAGRMEKVVFDDILFVESLQNYVLIHTSSKKIITYSTLKNIESLLPTMRFLKVQKSFIVAIDKISSLLGANIYIGDTAIPVSRKLREDIRNRILTNNLSLK